MKLRNIFFTPLFISSFLSTYSCGGLLDTASNEIKTNEKITVPLAYTRITMVKVTKADKYIFLQETKKTKILKNIHRTRRNK